MFDSNQSSRSITNAVIETLEERRLLSADLAPIFGNRMPADFTAGNTNHVVVDVLNLGDSKAVGPVTVDLFASPVSGGNDMLLGAMTKRLNVKAGRQGVMNVRFAEPTGLADGSYTLVAQIGTSGMKNTAATNDIVTSAAPMTLKNPFSDLAAKTVKAPTDAIVIDGNLVRQEPASVTIVNRGTAKSTGEVSVNFYLSTDTTLNGNDILVGTIQPTAANLRPGGSETLKGLIGAEGLAAGSYNLFAVVLPAGNVQNTAGDRIGLAAKQVQVIVIAPPPVINPITPTTTGTQSDSSSGQTGTTGNQSCDTSGQSGDTSGQSCDTSGQSCDTTGQSCDTSGQSCDTSGQTCDTGDQSTDDSGQPQDDQSQTQPADPSQDTSDQPQDPSTTDSGSDTSTDSSGDTSSTDSSGDTSSTDSSGDTSSTDSSGDTSSDDSSGDTSSTDSSGDTSSDDSSGGDESEGDFIARRSAQSTTPQTKPIVHKVAQVASSKHIIAKAPKAPARVISRK